jgi:hypothetical protein
MYAWIQPQIQRLCLREGMAFRPRHIGPRQWKESWVVGCVTRVEARLEASRRKYEAEAEASGSTGTALALRSLDLQVQDWLEKKYPKLKSIKSRDFTVDALIHGAEAGDRVSLTGTGQQVAAVDTPRLVDCA